jgi:hypothetical protein
VHDLTVTTDDLAGFTWAGVHHLASVRELALPLSSRGAVWAGDAFRGLAHLARLRLGNPAGAHAAVHGHAGLFAPGSLPRSLRHVELTALWLEWLPGEAPDGGAALLRPLAGVPDVTLTYCGGVGDGGLCALAGATRLTMTGCRDVAGERLERLGGSLQELTVNLCEHFTGAGLGSLAALRRLTLGGCLAFQPGVLAGVAAGCPALERVDVRACNHFSSEAAAAEAALLGAAAAAAGGGDGVSWAFTRGEYLWTATRCSGGAGHAVVDG